MIAARLPGGRATSAVGFGTAGLAGGSSTRASLRLLDAAFDAGVRHFDTAPLYGLGGAEAVLGRFLEARRGEVTVTTKFAGWRPAAGRAQLLGTARSLAKATIARIPGVRERLVRASRGIAPRPEAQLDAASFTDSLDLSLAALGTGHVDLLLLHEIECERVTDELRAALDRAVRDGKIGAWGVGGERRVIASWRGEARPRVVQTLWSPLLAEPFPEAEFRIGFGAIAGTLPAITAHLDRDGNRARWSEAVGADLADRDRLAALLLRAAVSETGGIALFTSRSPERIAATLAHLDADDAAAARALARLAADELGG